MAHRSEASSTRLVISDPAISLSLPTKVRYSCTSISGYSGGDSGKYPIRFLTSSGFSSTSNPATFADPEVGGRKQVNTRMVVVLPAPFGPRNPTMPPFSTSNEMLSTATVRAYLLVSPSTLIINVCHRVAKPARQIGRFHQVRM